MSVVESILDAQTDILTIKRQAEGTHDVDGIWRPGAATLLTVIANVQPATGMARVVGGRDMRQNEEGQYTVDVRAVFTETLLHTRDLGFEPDQIINFEGGTWIVVRTEKWTGFDDEVFYRCMITREMRGSC